MRFQSTFFALLSTIAVVSALNIFTVPETDLTSAGMLNMPKVAAPQAPARFRQATRASIIARQKRGPARRQISTSPICNRPITGTTNYAVFTSAFFTTDMVLMPGFAATVAECYAYCEANSECAAATHVGYAGAEDSSCVLLSEITAMSNYFKEEVVSEAKGFTCAQFKIAYPQSESWNCCDALRT